MKKLSIVLALVMALSCFCFTAFAAEVGTEPETTTEATTEATTAGDPATVEIEVIWQNLEGTADRTETFNYELAAGGVLTADDIIKAIKVRVNEDGTSLVDEEEYVISPVVVAHDTNSPDGYEFESVKVEAGAAYEYTVYAIEINDVENLAQSIATNAAGIDWKGIASANVKLINEIIKGAQAAVNSLVNADYPELGEEKEEETTAADGEVKGDKVAGTPSTGASSVAGVAVVVLALSATTAAVLRKKED